MNSAIRSRFLFLLFDLIDNVNCVRWYFIVDRMWSWKVDLLSLGSKWFDDIVHRGLCLHLFVMNRLFLLKWLFRTFTKSLKSFRLQKTFFLFPSDHVDRFNRKQIENRLLSWTDQFSWFIPLHVLWFRLLSFQFLSLWYLWFHSLHT